MIGTNPEFENIKILISEFHFLLQAHLIAKQLMEAYRTMTKEYTLSGVEERRKELVQKIEDAHAHLIRKNTALMTAYCYDQLMDAYQELHMEVSWTIFLCHSSFIIC